MLEPLRTLAEADERLVEPLSRIQQGKPPDSPLITIRDVPLEPD